jgi:hypothetical protein
MEDSGVNGMPGYGMLKLESLSVLLKKGVSDVCESSMVLKQSIDGREMPVLSLVSTDSSGGSNVSEGRQTSCAE